MEISTRISTPDGTLRGTKAQAAKLANPWGMFPVVAFIAAAGLLCVAFANTLSRSASSYALPAFWLGLAAIVLPITARVLMLATPRRERIWLVMLLGLGLYAVKIFHSPYAFTFSDELVHAFNADEVIRSGTLFHPNLILQIVPYYPGLENVAASLAMMSGLSLFHAGLIVIAAARLIGMLALFMIFERTSKSAHIASIACVFYIGNSNFLYFSAQFSYESLALPLALLVLAAIASRQTKLPADEGHWSAIILVLVFAVIVTHHMTSYLLIIVMILLAVLNMTLRWQKRYEPLDRDKPLGIWLIILFALTIQFVWTTIVARPVLDYLGFIFDHTIRSALNLMAGQESQRQLFKSSSGQVAPIWQRFLSLGAVALIALGAPIGIWRTLRSYRWSTFALLLAGATLTYFGALALRFSAAGWETANRASTILFVAVAFSLALAVDWLQKLPGLNRRLKDIAIVGATGVLFSGGVFAGWTLNLLLGQPYRVITNSHHVVYPEGISLANWMLQKMGPDNRVAASSSNAMLLLTYGQQESLSSWHYSLYEFMTAQKIGQDELDLLKRGRIDYLVFDQRRIGFDNMRGVYFSRADNTGVPAQDHFDKQLYSKLDNNSLVDRIYDSGTIKVYGVWRLRDAQAK